MVDTCRAPSVEPHDDGHRLLWTDQGVLREVRARSYRVTHTQFDPELVDRKVWPSKHRRELSRPLN